MKLLIICAGGLLFAACSGSGANEIFVDATRVESHITPYLYASCMEDVNHEIYGGLYAQQIFGESFEEPKPSPVFTSFTPFDGAWAADKDIVFVNAAGGAKLISNNIEMSRGSAQTYVKFHGNGGETAGLLINVTEPGMGSDNFNGYEICLTSNGRNLVLGKHEKNWQELRRVDVQFDPGDWNLIKTTIDGKDIEVFLNGKSVISHSDANPLASGKIGLRTWGANVSFKDLAIEKNGEKITASFECDQTPDISSQWRGYNSPDAQAVYTLETTGVFNGQNSQSVVFKSGTGVVGISNMGLNRWGIAVEKDQLFDAVIHLKGSVDGKVTVALQSADGTKEYAKEEIDGVTGAWKKFTCTLTANATDDNARFVVYLTKPGKITIDQVMLMLTGDKLFHGLACRKDIGDFMVNEKLTFLRYGGAMANSPEYRFKNMLGARESRPPYRGFFNPYSTNGFGIDDFVRYAEAAGFAFSFAVNTEESAQDVADMIEYMNGPATSLWGRKRAENGHPEPYGLKYLEVGNEEVIYGDDTEGYKHYVERFNIIYEAVMSKDPSVELINAAWWRPESANVEMVFRALNGKAKYWDYHPWADALTSGRDVAGDLARMQELFLKWDPDTRMKCVIFEENGYTHNMQRALGHVTIANAVRRAGDFVLTTCAANALQPYLQNDNEWDQGQIFFTPTQVWGMPPYYATRMSSMHHKPLNLNVQTEIEGLDITATGDEKGNEIVMHVANISDSPISTAINFNGFKGAEQLKIITLAAPLDERNSPEEPEKVVPVERIIKNPVRKKITFPAHSYVILIYSK